MIKYFFEKILGFIAPVISNGQTRFLVSTIAILAETYMSKKCDDTMNVKIAMISVAVITIIYIVVKTMYNYYITPTRESK